jgi:hypothetical protein
VVIRAKIGRKGCWYWLVPIISLHVKTSVHIPSALIGWNYVCTDIYILYLVYNYLCTHVAVKLACFDMQGDSTEMTR